MRIAIDLQSCLTDSRDRGIGRYSFSLATHIAALAHRCYDVVFMLDATDKERLLDLRRRLRHAGTSVRTAGYEYPSHAATDMVPELVAGAGLLRSRAIDAIRPDVLLVTSFFELPSRYTTSLDWAALGHVRKAVVAYDLIPLLFPERYLPDGHFVSEWYRKKIEEFKRFDLFLAISEATRGDLIRLLGIEPARIRVIGAGLDNTLLEAGTRAADSEDHDLATLGITKPFVLTVGNADWRKNTLGAVEAFASLPKRIRNAHQLVLTQCGDDVRNALRGHLSRVRDQVVVVGKVSDSILALLYAKCKVFFFPSLYEGFGLPVLEAMALGAPVLSSNQGSLHEVVHDPRVLFDPRDVEASSRALEAGLCDPDLRAVITDGAERHARTFTWDKCVGLALQALEDNFPSSPPRGSSTRWQATQEEVRQLADAMLCAEGDGGLALRSGLERIARGERRRILVDVTEVIRLDARSGIQRVVRNYSRGLLQLAEANSGYEVEPIQWTEQGVRFARGFARDRLSAPSQGEDDFLEVRDDDILFMVDSSWWAPERFDDLYTRVRKAGGEIVWMVYDLVPVTHPECCDPGMPPLFRHWLENVIRNADGCICISEATRADLEAFVDRHVPPGGPRPWTRSIHLGSDLESGRYPAPSENARRLVESLQRAPYLVVLGTIEPRKDYRTILDAMDRTWARSGDAALVIIGKQGWNVEALCDRLVNHPEYGRRLFWLREASDGEVRHLLAHAGALIQASVAEGYGLPVAEAGSLGIPLVLSDIPVFREIAGAEASYFKAGDAPALAAIVKDIVDGIPLVKPAGIKTMTWTQSTDVLAGLLLGTPASSPCDVLPADRQRTLKT